MDDNRVAYAICFILLIGLVGTWSTKSDKKVIGRSFMTNIIISGLLLLTGELTIFFTLVFFNLIVFVMGNLVLFKGERKKNFQKEMIDIPIVIILCAVAGMVVFTAFQSVDFFNFEKGLYFKHIEVVSFKEYIDLVCIIFAFIVMTIFFLEKKILKK